MARIFSNLLIPAGIVLATLSFSVLLIVLRPEKQSTARPAPVITLPVQALRTQTLPIPIRSQGTVQPHTRTELINQVPGEIISVSETFVAGGLFKKGELLLRIDPRNYHTQLKEAESQLAAAKSRLAQEEGQARVAYQDWLRRTRAAGLREEDAAATELAQRKPQLAEARAQLAAAEARLEQAQHDVERTYIRAPYDGMVQEKQAALAQYVEKGRPLGVIFAVDRAELRLPIKEHDLAFLELHNRRQATAAVPAGAPVQITALLGHQNFQRSGRLVRTEGVLNERTRVLYVVVAIEDPYQLRLPLRERDKILRMGTFVRARIDGRPFTVSILPQKLIQADNKLWFIDEGRIRTTAVQVLTLDGENMYLRHSLPEGTLVPLYVPQGTLPGMAVRPELAGGEAAAATPNPDDPGRRTP